MASGRGEGALLAGEKASMGMNPVTRSNIVQRDPAGHRRPAEIEKKIDQHQAPPENRHRIAGHRHVIPYDRTTNPLHRRQHASRHAEDDREEHGADRQLQCRGKKDEELGQDRAMGDQRDSEIAVQHIADIVGELDIERSVEAHPCSSSAWRAGAIPRSPILTSTGSPGTRWIRMKASKTIPRKVGKSG